MTTHTGSQLAVRPLAGALGAAVEGVDLTRDLTDATVAELRTLLDEHLVLFFPPMGVDDERQHAFASRFGSPYAHPIGRMFGRTAADVKVEHIVDSVEHPPYQDKWHTDVSWDAVPPAFGTLRAIEMPARGGDTIWSDARLAYDALSPVMQRIIDPLEAWHDMGSMTSFISKAGADAVARTKALFPGTAHPVVGTQEATGRRYLYVNREFTNRIVGMAPDESEALLEFLVGHAANPNFQVRYRWTVGDVAMWDERCTQHFAVADFLPERREMARVALSSRDR
jgi:taurine dioxygenase